MTWLSRAALSLTIAALALPACDRGPGGDGDGDGDGDGMWFELGHLGPEHFPDGFALDDLPYDPLEEGESVDMISGGQGAVMFAMPIRGGGFDLDPDLEPNDDGWPELNMYIDVEDHNDGIGGHFWRIANYPVWFDPSGEDEFTFQYLTVLLPDDYELSELEGLPATAHVGIEPEGRSEVEFEVDFLVGNAPE